MMGTHASRRQFLLAMRTACVAVAAIGGLGARRALGASESGATHSVSIDSFAFKPPVMTVALGDTVVWQNNDPVPHTVTAAGVFDSGAIAAGASWKYTANARGRHDYLCTFHPIMKGVLVVR